ncbi:MAG: hypothetical protein ACLQVI_23950 [Polyangiaceae bacterium]
MRFPLLLCFHLSLPLLLPLVPSCTPRASPPPASPSPDRGDYLSVHIDTVSPGLLGQFVDGRREWLAQLRRYGATDGRGVFLQVGDSTFYTVRRFSTFGSFDTRGEAIEKSLAAVPKEAGERYDHLADTSLVYPHTSEVWERVSDLSYAPAAGPLDERTACCGRLVIEDVRPDPASERAFSDATTAIDTALAEAHYPLTRTTYRTVFGAGHVLTLWLAPSREALDALPSVQDAVATVRGAARAAELTASIDSAVAHRETARLVVRHDMTQSSSQRPPTL